jgi:hypothetical protein
MLQISMITTARTGTTANSITKFLSERESAENVGTCLHFESRETGGPTAFGVLGRVLCFPILR